jgi:hypothetical protein
MRVIGFALAFASVVSGCGPDLGMCDKEAAERVVYLSDGTPYFEGQAIVHQSCAGSFCHANGAVGAARSGVPHGLNFDVQPVGMQSTPENLTALRNGIATIREEKDELYALVESGEMPPGDAGERPGLTWRTDKEGTIDALLPGVTSEAGKDKVRNWLACGAPLVSGTTDSPQAGSAALIGLVRDSGKVTTTGTFDSVYDGIFAGCVSCHGPGTPFATTQALDLSTKDLAFAGLVNKDAFATGACAGRKLVVPGSCETSLLYQKLLPAGQAQNLCGAPMPLGGTPIGAAQLAAVCDWIKAGATR